MENSAYNAIRDLLRKNMGESWDLTDDKGETMIVDSETSLPIRDVILSKDNEPAVLVPLGYFSDETIDRILSIMQ